MQYTVLVTLVLLTSFMAPPEEQVWLDRGATVLEPFKKQLKRELMEGMKKGTAHAIEVCSVRAQEIARALEPEGAVVGRTSHRLRNPENAPPRWVKPLLESYLSDPKDLEPRVVEIDERHIGYVEPIVVQPLCLTCHGSSLADPTREAINARYPDDQAVGFENGDFRGLFWAELERD